MEPERKIERRLRAYAQKRRAAAGDPLKLHPVTRRLLQGEAARRTPRPGEAVTPALFLAVLRHRLVFALCMVAIAFIGVSLFRPALSPTKKRAQSISTLNNPGQIGAATRHYAEGNQNVLPASLDKPTNQKSPALVLADKVMSEQPAKAVLPAPAAAAHVASDLEKSKLVAGASQSFVRTGNTSNQQNLYRNMSVAAQTAPVLQSFQVKQNGDAIFVVDQDGSVYQGAVQVSVMAERKEAAPVTAPTGGTAAPEPGQSGAMRSVQNYLFRVAGTNRTLNQNVVFSGNVEAIPGAPTRGRQTFGGDGGSAENQLPQATANTVLQNSLANSRIIGTAVINDTNRIEINAVRVIP